MADLEKDKENTPPADKTPEEVKDKAITTEAIIKSQASYKGDSQSDVVEVVIVKDGSFYKKGDKDNVHPTVAAILKKKGLIKSYKGEVTDKD